MNQMEMFFPVLTPGELDAKVNRQNPRCPFHASKYIGNNDAVEELLDQVYVAFETRVQDIEDDDIEKCPRTCKKKLLFMGGASAGKTTAARIFAQEILELPYCETVPEQLKSPEKLFELLKAAYLARGIEIVVEEDRGGMDYYILPAGVLFVDEIHLLAGTVQDSLLKMTEASDGLMLLDGAVVDCRQLCVIIGTTSKGKLRGAFKTRFRKIKFKRHTTAEIAKIVKMNYPTWNDACCQKVASLKPVPREAKDFAESVIAASKRNNISIDKAIKIVTGREGICEGGVTEDAVRVLQMLQGETEGLSVGTICAALDIEEDEFANDVKPCLIANSLHPAYIAVRGRHVITKDGLKYLDKLVKV